MLSMMHQTGGILDHWNPELEKIDRNMRLMQASPGAVCAGVKAGYYHLIRLRDPAEGTFMWVQPLMGPSGEFVEPNSTMLNALREADLQNARVVADRRRADERRAREQEHDAEAALDARLEEGMARYKAATRTQILTSLDVPYSQNNSSTAKRARGEKSKAKA